DGVVASEHPAPRQNTAIGVDGHHVTVAEENCRHCFGPFRRWMLYTVGDRQGTVNIPGFSGIFAKISAASMRMLDSERQFRIPYKRDRDRPRPCRRGAASCGGARVATALARRAGVRPTARGPPARRRSLGARARSEEHTSELQSREK